MSFYTSNVSSDNNTGDYVSVNSYDGDMIELYTAGTAPPSSISGITNSCSEFTFVTAPMDFNNHQVFPDNDFTFVNPFDHQLHSQLYEYSNDAHPLANFADQHFFYNQGHVGTVDNVQMPTGDVLPTDHLQQSAMPEGSIAGPDVDNESQDIMDPSTATIHSLIQRMESSVGAILVGINTLTANDGAVNPQAISQPSSGQTGGRHSRRYVKMAPFTRQIREELKKLLGRRFMEEGQVIPSEALKAFAESFTSQTEVSLQPVCCQIEDFRIDLLGSPRSPWNQSAARVFSAHFIQSHSTPQDQQHLVQHYFYQRMKCLQAAYRKARANAAAQKAAATARRRHQRRNALFTKRVDIALQHPLLREHVPILRKLGVSGMSSDESDIEDETSGQVTRYLIHKPVWRDESLSAWLRVFDSLHVLSRKLSAAGTRGSFPRLRIESGIESTRGFVGGLPVTAYDSKWLGNHIAASFNVGQTTEEYSFTHHNQIFSYLRYRRM